MFNKVFGRIISAEITYLKADWWVILLGIGIAVTVKVYLGSGRIQNWVEKNDRLSIFGSIGFGTFTPLCACGTMAVVLSMFASYLPWGAVMAFLVSSPLTSPSQFLFQSEFLGPGLAAGILISSIVLGIGAGFLANLLERRTSFFYDQHRVSVKTESVGQGKAAIKEQAGNQVGRDTGNRCCNQARKRNHSTQGIVVSKIRRWKLDQLLKETYQLGVKKVLFYFMLFIAIGQLVEMVVPTEWILNLFSGDRIYSIPLAAIVGLPLYVSGTSALPLLESILKMGAGEGAVLTFILAGQGTGIAAITGMAAIIKKKAMLFYVVYVFFGAILSGYIYQLLVN